MLALTIDCLNAADTLDVEADMLNITDVPIGFDFQSLDALEMVTSQFSEVVFGCAIALTPSNPRFMAKHNQRVIMPTGNDNHLSIAIDKTINSFCLWGRCTQPMVLKVLESSGKLLNIHTDKAFQWPDSSDTALLPLQVLKLANTSNIAIIELSADAPFTIEGLSV